MGLDQYAVSRLKGSSSEESESESFEISYWRKHNALHGWMEQLFRLRFPESDEEFNCINLILTEDDINALEKAVLTYSLPVTDGFFFGCDTSRYDPYREKDLEFIQSARRELLNDREVIYSAWY